MDGLINSFPIKFRQKISIKDSGCWEWIGARDRHGYGRYYCRLKYKSIGKKNHTLAHRFSWEHFKGQIPLNLFVCHKCDNPPCVNPEHLFLGTTHAERRNKRTKCCNGHAWVVENLYIDKNGYKLCRICRAIHKKNSRKRSSEKNLVVE